MHKIFSPSKITNIQFRIKCYVVILGLTVALLSNLVTMKAQAAALTNAFVRIDRMQTNTATGGTVCAKAATTATEASVNVVFPGSGTLGAASFGVNTTAANWTVTTTDLPAGSTAWPGIGTATAVSGATVTFPSTDLTVGTLYCFNFSGSSTLTTSTSVNSNMIGSITTRDSVPATIDTKNYATAVIGDDTIDVTATVSATFNFTLSGTTDALSTLSTSAVISSPTPRTVTIGTNATNGFIVWVKSANQGLLSTTASDEIDTTDPGDNDCSPVYGGSGEFYGLDADETTDPQTNGTINTGYNCTGTDSVGSYESTFKELASSSGPSSGYVLTLYNRAAADIINKAATDYSDTVTVVGAGNF